MRVRWTDEALDDLAGIIAYYLRVASPWTAEVVRQDITAAVMEQRDFSQRIRISGRVPRARWWCQNCPAGCS